MEQSLYAYRQTDIGFPDLKCAAKFESYIYVQIYFLYCKSLILEKVKFVWNGRPVSWHFFACGAKSGWQDSWVENPKEESVDDNQFAPAEWKTSPQTSLSVKNLKLIWIH